MCGGHEIHGQQNYEICNPKHHSEHVLPFQLYESLSQYTRASVLTDTSKKTPVFVRFSTVAGFRVRSSQSCRYPSRVSTCFVLQQGSADTVRDVRGFAVKFYTDEGNWDLVGNNIPVFFIQDAVQFPDLVHSIKPEPHNEMPQAQVSIGSPFQGFGSVDLRAHH